MAANEIDEPEILLEIMVQGRALRVTAVDPVSFDEVVFVAPMQAPRASIARLARSKLASKARRACSEPSAGGGIVL